MTHQGIQTAIPQTLFDISGVKARILMLPGRPRFILDADMAEVYDTVTRRVNEAVKRNPDRFPDDFSFVLTEAEMEVLRSQNATANKSRSPARAFTHIGAYALSGVLKTPVAARMSVIIHRAFAAMEQQAVADAKAMVAKLRIDILRKKPIYAYVELSVNAGLSLEAMWRGSNYPKWKLEQAARELRAMRIVERLPEGMQDDLFGEAHLGGDAANA